MDLNEPDANIDDPQEGDLLTTSDPSALLTNGTSHPSTTTGPSAANGTNTTTTTANGLPTGPNGSLTPHSSGPRPATRNEQLRAKKVPDDQRNTTPYLTKYERARVLGARATQISLNAPVLVDLEGETDPLEIAKKELAAKRLPLVVRRFLPDGAYEDWPVRELIL